jgi:hypothetical protein
VLFDPGIQDGKKIQDRESGMNIPDLNFLNLVSIFWVKILNFFDADPDPGSGINIPDPQHCPKVNGQLKTSLVII